MHVVKIFIASSEELTPERRVLADMQAMLNNRLFKQGVILQLEFWEHFDSSMNIKEKQEEYNDVIRECDGCIVLFRTKFGEFTHEELEVAYKGQVSGAYPKQLRVLFKDTTEQTPDLKVFKDEFVANYGDISSTFSTNDELRLALIEQVETILADGLEAPLYSIGEDDKVVIGGAVMDKIKVLNVYLAVADDVEVEQNEFMDLVSHINKIFIRRNMCLNIIKHKQNMGNLRECELCMTLYCTKFGDYTKDDLKSAYRYLQEGNNPRKLYVFFKNSDIVTPELQTFKDDFVKDFGHFFCKFENVDTMRLEFLLQLEAYQNYTSEKLLKVNNQKIEIDGTAVVDLNNIPFAALNKKYTGLRDGIEKLNKQIQRCNKRLDLNPNDADSKEELREYEDDLKQMQEEFDLSQQTILNTALRLAKLSEELLADGLNRAMNAFNEGDMDKTNNILDEILANADADFEDFKLSEAVTEQKRKKIIQYITALFVKCDAIFAKSTSIEERIKEVEGTYVKAYKYANGIDYINIDKDEYCQLIDKYVHFATKYAKYDLAEQIGVSAIEIFENSYGKESEYTANLYCTIGKMYYDKGDNLKSLEMFRKSITILNCLNNNNSLLINIYNGMGMVYAAEKNNKQAFINYSKALELSIEHFGWFSKKSAGAFNNIGLNYFHTGHYALAVESFENALTIHTSFLGDNNIAVATNLNNLALAQMGCANIEESKQNFNKALEIRENLLGKNHPDTASIYHNLGALYKCVENYYTAIDYLNKALQVLIDKLGIKHRNTISTMELLAEIYKIEGDHYRKCDNYANYIRWYETELNLRYYIDKNDVVLVEKNQDIGNIALENEDYDRAMFYYKEELRLLEEKHTEDYTSIIDACSRISDFYYNSNKSKESLTYLLKIWNIAKENNYHSVKIALASFRIGELYLKDKQFDKALTSYKYSIEEYDNQQKIESDECGFAYNRIATLFHMKHDFISALKFHIKSLSFCISKNGENHISTSIIYDNIGDLYESQKNYIKALVYFSKALKIKEKTLGAEHPTTVSSALNIRMIYYNIAENFYKNDDYMGALTNYLKCVSIEEDILGIQHEDTIRSYEDIANTYATLENFENATIYFKKCADVKISLGINNEATANLCAYIGYCSNDFDIQLEYHQKALHIRKDILGLEHSDTAQSYFDVGDVYVELEDYTKALCFFDESLSIRIKSEDGFTEECATTYNNIGYTYNEMGDYSKAMEKYKKALDIREKVFGEDDVQTANSYHHIGKTYKLMGDYAEAMPYLEKALVIRERELGAEDDKTTATKELLEEVKSKL